MIVDLDRLVKERYSFDNRGHKESEEGSSSAGAILGFLTLAASAYAAYKHQQAIKDFINDLGIVKLP